MLPAGSRRPFLLIACTVGLLGGLAAADAAGLGSGQAQADPPASTSPRVGEPLEHSTPTQIALGAHLRSRGALFYGAWWCPACFQQKNLFGKEAGNQLPYVECDQDGSGRQRCAAAGIRAFPTWDLPGKPRLEGVQSLEELAAWSDFSAGRLN
jgi:hypothetical protein